MGRIKDLLLLEKGNLVFHKKYGTCTFIKYHGTYSAWIKTENGLRTVKLVDLKILNK